MPLKKTANSLSHSAMPSTFRTLIKNRVNKQTIKDVVHLSAALQQNLDQDDKRSIKSSASVHKKSDFQNFGTDKLKSFVRNMKNTNQAHDQAAATKTLKAKQSRDLTDSRTSLYSVRSIKSKAQNLISYHVEKDISDNRSMISTRSLAESQILSKSKIFFSKHNDGSNKQRLFDKLTKMEERLDYLNRNKLKNLMLKARSPNRYHSRPFIGSGAYNSTIESIQENNLLEKQFQSILAAILSLKQKDSQDRLNLSQLEQNISELDKKIELLEKILASNYTEAEILRKYYFAQKSQKCPHLSRKDKIMQGISKMKVMLKSNNSMIEMRVLRKKQPIIRYESSSKYFYAKPSQAAYLSPKDRVKQFVPNRQPFPRSSYDREFLNYGTLPVFNYRPHDSNHSTSKLHTKTSNYQQTFKQRHMDLKQINYKELDCFKDKLKMGTVSFSELYKNKGVKHISMSKQKDPKRKQKQNKNSIQKAMETLNSLQSQSLNDSGHKFMGSTEMKTQYIWHSTEKGELNDTNIEDVKGYGRSSVIKNGKLNNLKASYRMQFLR